jgi:CubicO group peptidase (beta-lactamase class C family)
MVPFAVARKLPALLSIWFLSLILTCTFSPAQSQLPSELQTKIDEVANNLLARSGVPSASVAIVKDGQIAYLHAYGNAHLDPVVAAKPEMRYSIGSISKQFTAASILLLQEQGKLSLDDKVGKYLPNLTRANEVTIRQLLSHTSGYQDYWPQDYVMPMMLKPTTAQYILDKWAKIPLDFDPGTKWQYSNTNYVIAGVIIEKVSGVPLLEFLQKNVFVPLGMKSVADSDASKLGDTDATGYMRYAVGPLRPSPKEGTGWLFAAGELAMPAEDLAKWDISIIDQKLLKPASYQAFGTEIVLKNGLGTRYGLGVDVRSDFGHRVLAHGGEVSGYTSENVVFPDDRVAVVVLTNQDAVDTSSAIARSIAPLLLAKDDPATPAKLEQAKKIFAGLQHGAIDRSLFTDNANFYFNDQALKDFSGSLGPLGEPQSFTQVRQGLRGGMTLRVYSVKFPNKTLEAWSYEMPDGKLEQYLVAPQD